MFAELRGSPFITVNVESINVDPSTDESEMSLKLNAGGGITSTDEIIAVLLLAVEELSGVDASEYAQLIDAYRAAAGLSPLLTFPPKHGDGE